MAKKASAKKKARTAKKKVTRKAKAAPKAAPKSASRKRPPARKAAPQVAGAPGRDHPYAVHPGVAAMQEWVTTLAAKTGRSIDEWVRLVQKEGPREVKAAREWLKNVYTLGSNTAWTLADRAFGVGENEDTPEAYLAAARRYVEAMFSGGRSGLRPIYDRALSAAFALGDDVKACPCQTIVPLYRRHVFAQLKPSTRTRLDLGLALARYAGPLPVRLVDTGGAAKKDRITHRIELASPADLDAEAKKWLKVAYELDA